MIRPDTSPLHFSPSLRNAFRNRKLSSACCMYLMVSCPNDWHKNARLWDFIEKWLVFLSQLCVSFPFHECWDTFGSRASEAFFAGQLRVPKEFGNNIERQACKASPFFFFYLGVGNERLRRGCCSQPMWTSRTRQPVSCQSSILSGFSYWKDTIFAFKQPRSKCLRATWKCAGKGYPACFSWRWRGAIVTACMAEW